MSVTNFTLTRRDRNQINARRYHYLDTTIRKPVHTGSVEHHLLFGINGGYELNDFDQRQFNSLPSLNVNIYAPVYGAPNLPPKPGTHQHFTFNNQAAYLTDQIDLGPQWKALAGLRATRQTSDFQDLRATPVLPVRHGNLHAFLPLAGLVFQPNATWSLYSSFSTSFNPVRPNFVDVNGEATFKPERGRQIEAGAKTSLAHGRGEASLALFNITRTGVILSLTTQFPNAQQIGQERSRGLELSVSQRILNNWQAILGYGYTDAHITQDLDPRRVGARTQNVPRHNGNLWTRYDVAGGALRGLGFGLGLVYSGERAGTLPASNSTLPVLSLPSYFRIDAGLYYVARRYELTARVVNLRDEFYYESSSALGGANQLQLRPGAPRAATLSLRCKF